MSDHQEVRMLISQKETFFQTKYSQKVRASVRKSMLMLDDKDRQQLATKLARGVQDNILELQDDDSDGSAKKSPRKPKKIFHQDKKLLASRRMNQIELSSLSDALLVKFHIGIYKDNALTYKIRFDDKSSVEYLLKRGVSLLTRDVAGHNLLHLAVKIERLEYLAFLCEGSFSSPTLFRVAEAHLYKEAVFDAFAHQRAKELCQLVR